MIRLDIDAQGIATLTIDQPRTMNVIDWDFPPALDACLDRIARIQAQARPQDPQVRGLIVTSAKSSFVAGADLAIMADFVAPGVGPADAARLIARIGAVLRRLETLGLPVVGASTGTALGGGLELLLACHHRIAADTPGAVYGLPEVTLGLLPGAGGTQRLPRLLGLAAALPLMISGRPLSTTAAHEMGLLDAVVPTDDLLPAARRALLAGRVAAQAPWDRKGWRLPGGDSSTPAAQALFMTVNAGIHGRSHGLQPAPGAIASCVYEGSRLPFDRALRIEQQQFARLVQGAEAQAMIRTLFFGRQALEKAPGRPAAVPRQRADRLLLAGDAPWLDGLRVAALAAGLTVVRDTGPAVGAEGGAPIEGVQDGGCAAAAARPQAAAVTDAGADAGAGAGAGADAQGRLCVGEGPGALALRWFAAWPGDLPPVLEIAPRADTDARTLAVGVDLARQLRAVPLLLPAADPGAAPRHALRDAIDAVLGAARQAVAGGDSPVVVDNLARAGGWPALATLAAAIGQAWPPAAPADAAEGPAAGEGAPTAAASGCLPADDVAARLCEAQRGWARALLAGPAGRGDDAAATTTAAGLTTTALDVAAVLGAGFPRHLGGPACPPSPVARPVAAAA
ncbi:MAG: hypothetical protein RIQ53_3712 [Pseudomonadota bacterium]